MHQSPGRVERAAAKMRKVRWPLGALAVPPYLLFSDVDGARWVYIALGLGVVLPIWTFPAVETGIRKFREGYNGEPALVTTKSGPDFGARSPSASDAATYGT